MTVTVTIDTDLLEAVMKIGGFDSPEAAVSEALRSYIRTKNQVKIVSSTSTTAEPAAAT